MKSRQQQENSNRASGDAGSGTTADAGPSSDAGRDPISDASEPDGTGQTARVADAAAGAGAGAGAGGAAGAGTGGSTALDAMMGGAGGASGTAGNANTAGAAGCSGTSCSAAIPECKADQDCLALGPEYSGGVCANTHCVPNPKWRCEAPAPTSAGMRELAVPLIDALSLEVLADTHIVACAESDSMCTQPIAQATSGKDGIARISLPSDFNGYLQQSERTDYTPSIYALPSPFPADGKLRNYPMYATGAVLRALAVALGAELDPKRGYVDVVSIDCFGEGIGGVSFSSPQRDMATLQFYVSDGVPFAKATFTTPNDGGGGGFLNLQPGIATVSAKSAETGLDLGTARIPVRGGFTSVAYIRPPNR